jgi:hypothetical protein
MQAIVVVENEESPGERFVTAYELECQTTLRIAVQSWVAARLRQPMAVHNLAS